MEQKFERRFQLTHGCISLDERLTSRDIGQPTYFETRDEAEKRLQEHSEFYRSIGYKIWFSHIREWNPEKKEYQ